MPSPRRAHAALIVSTLLVATSFPVVATIAGALDSLVLTWLRFVAAALLFLPLVLRRHGAGVWPGPVAVLRFALLSAPLVGFFAAMFEALRTTSPLNTGALFSLAPAFATVAGVLLGGPAPGRRTLLGLAAGLAGALWVVFRGDPARLLALRLAPGDLIYLAGTASLGLYSALIPRLRRDAPLELMTFWTLVTGAGWLSLLGAGALAATPVATLSPRVLGAVAYLALFTTLVTFLLSQAATTTLGPTRGMAYTYLTPTLVGLLSWGLGAEPLGWSTLPGVLLTLAALAVLLPSSAWSRGSGAVARPLARRGDMGAVVAARRSDKRVAAAAVARQPGQAAVTAAAARASESARPALVRRCARGLATVDVGCAGGTVHVTWTHQLPEQSLATSTRRP